MQRSPRSRRSARLLCSLLATGGLVVLAACSSAAGRTAEPVTLRISSLLSDMPVVLADEEGFFADEGVELELGTTTSVAELVPLLDRREIDVWVGSPTPALYALIDAGIPIRIVADKGHVGTECAYFSMVVRDELVRQPGWDRPENLRGRTFSVGSSAVQPNLYLDEVLADLGLDRSAVRVEQVPYPSAGEAAATGQVDVALVVEPLLTSALGRGGLQSFKPSQDVVPGMQVAVLVFGPRLIEDDPELGERFLRAYLRGVERYNEGATDRNIEVIAPATGIDEDVLRRSCWPAIRADGAVDVESLLQAQRWAVDAGMQDDIVPAERIWDGRFVARARDGVS